MKMNLLLAALVVLLACAVLRAATYSDGTGKISAIVVGGQPFEVGASFSIFAKGWGSSVAPNPWNDQGLRMQNAPDGRLWSGRLREGGTEFDWSERLRDVPNGAELVYRFVPQAKPNIEGVLVMVDVNVAEFSGGTLAAAGAPPIPLPATAPADVEQRHLGSMEGKAFAFASADGKTTLQVTLDRPCHVLLQDARVYKRDDYQLLITAAGPDAAAGVPIALSMTLVAAAPVDTAPVTLALGAPDAARPLAGLGGNYCFDINSPVTAYTLAHLPSAWARHEIRMTQWQPRNPADRGGKTNLERLAAADLPNSEVHGGFVVAQELTRRGVPLVFSLWRPGGPFYVAKDQARARGDISPEGWPMLLDAMTDYVLYAKEKYGVEPALISTNESDQTVDVHLTGEDERRLVKDLGARLAKAGLKTKLLLGDIAALRDGTAWLDPTLADPAALPYVGAIGLHNWGDGSRENYLAWHDVSQRTKLPLLITEFGADANWRMAGTQGATFYYGLNETRILMQALAWARPTTVLYWEYTGDYALVRLTGSGAAWSKRAEFWRQVAALTPPHALPRAADGAASRILAVGYQGPSAAPDAAAVHVLNRGTERALTLTGIQDGVPTLHVYVTDDTRGVARLADVPVHNGSVQVTLPGQSLLTLTTETLQP